MIGITSYGGYVPFFRLSRDLMAKAWGRGSMGGERSVANNDEDSATMAVEAAFDCLQGKDRKDLGGLYFASTTAPYREKEISSLVAATVDLPGEIRTADFGNGLRAGAAALRSAFDERFDPESSGCGRRLPSGVSPVGPRAVFRRRGCGPAGGEFRGPCHSGRPYRGFQRDDGRVEECGG